jgi:hypothetical protein
LKVTGESYVNLSPENWFSDRGLNPRLPTQFINLVTTSMVSEAVVSSKAKGKGKYKFIPVLNELNTTP